jgi:hypothetical protein
MPAQQPIMPAAYVSGGALRRAGTIDPGIRALLVASFYVNQSWVEAPLVNDHIVVTEPFGH